MDSEKFILKDLSKDITNEIVKELSPYVTPIITLNMLENEIDFNLLGSGTFVKVKDKYGVLTAQHVINSKKFKNCDEVGFSIREDRHKFSIKKKYLEVIEIGYPLSDKDGPDLALIILNEPDVSTVKATKSFWNMDKYIESNIDIKIGAFCLFGCPNEMVTIEESLQRFEDSKSFGGLAGIAPVDKEWEREGFSFYNYVVSYDELSDTPDSFEGVSGAGLWHIKLFRNKEGLIKYDKPILAGVAFFQSSIDGNLRSIICNGKKSLYEKLYEYL